MKPATICISIFVLMVAVHTITAAQASSTAPKSPTIITNSMKPSKSTSKRSSPMSSPTSPRSPTKQSSKQTPTGTVPSSKTVSVTTSSPVKTTAGASHLTPSILLGVVVLLASIFTL